jgi:hypothetical protein
MLAVTASLVSSSRLVGHCDESGHGPGIIRHPSESVALSLRPHSAAGPAGPQSRLGPRLWHRRPTTVTVGPSDSDPGPAPRPGVARRASVTPARTRRDPSDPPTPEPLPGPRPQPC